MTEYGVSNPETVGDRSYPNERIVQPLNTPDGVCFSPVGLRVVTTFAIVGEVVFGEKAKLRVAVALANLPG